MSKLKTHKATLKRVKLSKPKKGARKILTKACGQAHFNAGENGKTTRQKRNYNKVAKQLHKNIITLIPHN